MRIKFSKLIGGVIAMAVCACGGGGGSDEGGDACGALNARIFGGESCNQSARSPVVAIVPVARDGEQLAGVGICSGTLVTVDDILTSAHCFTDPAIQLGDTLAAFVVFVGGANGEARVITNLAVHPDYNGVAGSRFDIAMATLDQIPSPPIGPVPVLLSELSLPDQRASTFGYGTNSQGEVGELRSAEITINDIQDGNLIVTLEESGASICQGDSGGPLVQVINGVTSIIGVNSFVTATSEQCAANGASISGFVDLQHPSILSFLGNYAPDIAAN